MAGGRPIITCIDGEGSRVIQQAQAGCVGESGNPQALYENIMKVYNMSCPQRKAMGDNAKSYHLKHHSREKVLKQLIDFIFN